MRCNFYLSDYNAAIESANSLLASEKVQQEIVREAHYILAKSYLETQNSKAIDELKIVSADVKSDEGAECKYLLAKAYFDIDKKDLAEKEIFDFIKKNTSNHYWLGKSFLLLADIYIARKDEFQAVQTLQSLINNYETPDDGIIDEAKAKRAQIVANSPSQQEKKDSDIEINMNQQKLQ